MNKKIKGYSIFWAQVIALIFWTTLGFVTSTQLFAFMSQLSPASLGTPYFYILDYPFYHPWKFLTWAIQPWEGYDTEFLYAFTALGSSFVFFIMTAAWLSIVRHREDGQADSHGDSRWATEKEMKNSEVTFDESALRSISREKRLAAENELKTQVILGKLDDGTLIRHTGPQHIAVIAPSRAEKGVSIIIPSLFSWLGSSVVTDIKKENYFATSGFRAQFSHVVCLDPTDWNSAAWNPLMEIRKGLQFEVRDTQNVAITLIDPDGEKQKSDHWDRAGYDLLTGAILHVLYAENDKTLSGVTKFLSDPNRTIYETLTAMLKTRHLGDKPHPTIASLARSMLNKSPNELSGVQSTILGYLSLYRDPTVAHITRACDFKVLDLVNADKPVSLYIVVSPADISRTAPLVRLLLNMIGSRLAEVPLRPGINNSPYKHKLLLLMDELPAFGYMQFYEKALGYIAGYGIRSMLIAQSLAQIEKLYGKKNALLEACHILAFFTPNPKDVDGAKEISEILGDTTRERRNSMFSGGRLAIWLRNVTVSAQEMGRKLLTPGEILRLDKDKIILIVSRLYPMLINKVRYYEDPLFSSRQLPDIPTDGTYKDYPQSKESEWANCIVGYVPEDDEEEDNTGAAATVSIVLAGKEDDKNTEQKGQEEHTVDNTVAPENEPVLSPQQQLQMQQSQQRVEDRRHDHHDHKHNKDDKGKGISDGIVW